MVAVTRENRSAGRRRDFHEGRLAEVADRDQRSRMTVAWGWWLAEFKKASEVTREEMVRRLLADARWVNGGGSQ